MVQKKLINGPEFVVLEMLEGIVMAHPGYVRKLENANVLVRTNSPIRGKVALVSGGGKDMNQHMEDMWEKEC